MSHEIIVLVGIYFGVLLAALCIRLVLYRYMLSLDLRL